MLYPTINLLDTKPNNPDFHIVRTSNNKRLLFEVKTGRILESNIAPQDTVKKLSKANALSAYFLETPPPKRVPIQSLSLAIAQKCNLGCTYCYAEQGTFGGRPDNMSIEIAKASVDRLLLTAPIGETIRLAFMGGEPLFNRSALHQTTAYAAKRAMAYGRKVAFSITTNGTLIRPEDVNLFQQYRFTVTLSLDGIGAINDKLRPYISGKGSFKQVEKKLKLLLDLPDRKFKVIARATVTPKNLNLTKSFQAMVDLGFDAIQFSPLLKSPSGAEELSKEDFELVLQQLIQCGELFRRGFKNKQLLPLQNVISTLRRIHFYERDNYPCGAGGGYMGVSSEGELYACHRFVNDEDGHLGNIGEGVDPLKQERWLENRHLNNQSPCTSCWARYLCNGNCHHEVIKRGRPACDYIRGWLYYCLGLYAELMESDPIGLQLLIGDHQAIALNDLNSDGTGMEY